jgi:hypothetical protein
LLAGRTRNLIPSNIVLNYSDLIWQSFNISPKLEAKLKFKALILPKKSRDLFISMTVDDLNIFWEKSKYNV